MHKHNYHTSIDEIISIVSTQDSTEDLLPIILDDIIHYSSQHGSKLRYRVKTGKATHEQFELVKLIGSIYESASIEVYMSW